MGFTGLMLRGACVVSLESKVMRNYCFVVVGRDAWLEGLIGLEVDLCHQQGFLYLQIRGVSGFGMGEVVLSTFEELQMLGFFLQMGFTLILATLDGLDVGLLDMSIGEDDLCEVI
ncbi:hypothetical protein Tco_1227122 [Tanacetum coccineum]